MINDPFDNLTDEEKARLFMYMISNQDKIRAKIEQWSKEAEEREIRYECKTDEEASKKANR